MESAGAICGIRHPLRPFDGSKGENPARRSHPHLRGESEVPHPVGAEASNI
eukprot:CAMPEP_0202959222 /NCGR_PEP_ID=MMETSP1396-20130829/3469_1 /ASSEMBLY_ACC=CAM_ASM_000872 /TAXON_ID= /ORGANISM="Pseudokeronopsis sp., Strain Brazil" /LENGTH=50 /DNA_ID=CAMNT_0049677689 /DNA_START=399 /DNA_END=551 /DNA_ORIENTATION=+